MKNIQVLLDSFPKYGFILNKDAKILYSNEKAKLTFGREAASFKEIMPEGFELVQRRVRDALMGKGPFDLSFDGIKANLALLPLEQEDAVVLYLESAKGKSKKKGQEIQAHVFDFLNEIAEDPTISSWEKIQKGVAAALDIFDLDIGIISQIKGHDYEVKQSLSKLEDIEIAAGTRFELGQTYCDLTWSRREVVAVPHAREDDMYSNHPSYINMKLESYIGMPLMIKGKPYGTFNLSSPKVSTGGFSKTALQYFRMLGMWIERLIEGEEVETKNRELDRLFQGIFYESPSAMVFISSERKIKMVNNAFKALFKLSEEQVLDSDTRILYATDEDYQSLFQKTDLKTSQGNTSYEMNYQKGDGDTFIAETIGYPVRDDLGDISGYIGIMRDRTEEIEKEKELREQKAMAEHHSRFAAIGEISAGVAHEVNNPLAVVKGYAAIIGQKVQSGKRDINKDLEKIDNGIDRVSKIIRSLGVLARQENDFGDHSAVGLVEETVNLVREFYRRQGLKLLISENSQGIDSLVSCHKGKAHQAIYNLLEWARGISLSSTGREIHISVAEVGDCAEIMIATKTKLINWEEAMNDPSSANRLTSLKVAKSILATEGCALECRSDEKNGNRVAVILPLAESFRKKALA